MINLFKSNLARLRKEKLILYYFLVTILLVIFSFFNYQQNDEDSLFFLKKHTHISSFNSIIIFFFLLFIISKEYDNNAFYHKIYIGETKPKIFFTNMITSLLVTFILYHINFIIYFSFSFFLSDKRGSFLSYNILIWYLINILLNFYFGSIIISLATTLFNKWKIIIIILILLLIPELVFPLIVEYINNNYIINSIFFYSHLKQLRQCCYNNIITITVVTFIKLLLIISISTYLYSIRDVI